MSKDLEGNPSPETSNDKVTDAPASELVVEAEKKEAPKEQEAPKVSLPLRIWRIIVGGPTNQAQGQPVDGTREVVETVVFVVVLVLMLKSFVAEAFVIPTGSMAETLWGYQKIVTCPQCEYTFPVNVSSEVEPHESAGITIPVRHCTCPNCRNDIELLRPGSTEKPDGSKIPDPGWNTGDRVLVAKFLYDLFGRMPDRYDTVVFKFPGNNDLDRRTTQPLWPNSGPQKDYVPMNYIKRLVGFPGETLAIYGGDLFASPPDMKKHEKQDFAGLKDEESIERRRQLLWMKKYVHEETYRARGAEYPDMLAQLRRGPFQIVRKSPDKILSMKRIVYDNEHQAKDLQGVLPPRWQPEGSVWQKDGKSFSSSGGNKAAFEWLRYHHILRKSKGKAALITDFMGYNAFETNPPSPIPGHILPPENWVGDLVLEGEVETKSADGVFVMELSQGIDRFQARFDLSNGSCSLHRIQNETELKEPLASKTTKLKGTGTFEVRFANVDRQLVVWVDGEPVFEGNGVAYQAPSKPGPTKENDLNRPASFGSKGASVVVHKLRLWRDTYYTQEASHSDSTRSVDFTNPEDFGELRGLPITTLYVQPDHFLCMGDNSPESSDGRTWGLVPRRLLLGKAVVVYYPFKFPWLSKVNRLGIIE